MGKAGKHKNIFEGYSEGYSVCVIIPTYNNGKTILAVIRDVQGYCPDIIVVDDGSTDNTKELLDNLENIEVISYEKNKGKGYAIRQGFKRALEKGFDYAATIDADGQHYASDLPVFAGKLKEEPDALIIGSRNIEIEGMPAKNTFANKFSNFWFRVETGQKLPDTQSGYRLYPVRLYRKWKFFTTKYEFEVEVLVRSAWSGIKIVPVPVRVFYPKEEERVTHFRPLPDFARISVLNTVLVLITFLFIIPRNALRYLTRNKFMTIVKEQILAHNESPFKVSAALGFGVFMGIVPIWGFQMLAAAFLAHFMRLNKIIVLAASNISIPPMIPFIVYFSYKAGGLVLNHYEEISVETLQNLKTQIMAGNFYATLDELGYSIFQYVIGALVFALVMGLATGVISYLIMKISLWMGKKKKLKNE
ncbi:MAG: DUF2062 domain-containing protein [Chlorobi bacterium]|nr:DUF2062 domain-containing protein [Chlorobiota bacterium]